MSRAVHVHPSDIQGLARLATDATTGLTDLVEAVHHGIARGPRRLRGQPRGDRTGGITGFVYRRIRDVTSLVAAGLDTALAPLAARLGAEGSSDAREAALAALNGVLGDHLAATGNPLAIRIALRRDGRPLPPHEVIPPSGRLLVLAHGLCMNDRQWNRQGHDHGAALARDLGFTPAYLHYNTGLHISTNGRAFAELLESVVEESPRPIARLVIVGHSMGGLVARSAHHWGSLAGHRWPRLLRSLVFLGTPHHGAPLERGGNRVDRFLGATPYAAPFARLGKIRSAGITDLRHGNLRDEDWQGCDRFARARDERGRVPLPAAVRSYAIAATRASEGLALDRLPGDGIVPLASALGLHADPTRALAFAASRRHVGYQMNHLDLLSRSDVYARIRRWLAR